MDNESRHRVVGVRPRKSSQSRRRSASKVVTESSAFGLESRNGSSTFGLESRNGSSTFGLESRHGSSTCKFCPS